MCKGFSLNWERWFALLGREYRLVVGETEQFLDFLFYQTKLHCYVVVEIKIRKFEPGDMGQLGAYVAAVNGMLRQEGDGETIGLLICKTKDNVLARYASSAINVPVGISEYKLAGQPSKRLKNALPSAEEIQRELNQVEKRGK